MAAFTKLAQCGHWQAIVCDNATAATCIEVAACAMCNPEKPVESRFAVPKLNIVPLFSDESLEIADAVEKAKREHRQVAVSFDTDLERLVVVVPDGLATFAGFPITSLHLALLRLKVAEVKVVQLEEGKIFVNASRYKVLSALNGKVAGVRFFRDRTAAVL